MFSILPTLAIPKWQQVIQTVFLFPERYVIQILIASAILIVAPLVALAYAVNQAYKKYFPET